MKRKFSESTNQISLSRSRFIDWWQRVELFLFGWNGTDWVGISWEELSHPERAIMFGSQKANSNYRAEISLISNVGEFPKSHATRMCSLLVLFADRAAVQIFLLTTSTRKPRPEAKKIFAMRHDNVACSGGFSYIANWRGFSARSSIDKQTSLKM